MNPRNAITFLRSPSGALLAFVLLLIGAIVFVKGFYDPNKNKPKTPTALTPGENTNRTLQVMQTIQHEIVPFKPPIAKPTIVPASPPAKPPQETNAAFTPISLYIEAP